MRTIGLLLTLSLAALPQDEKIQTGTAPCRPLRPCADPALQELLKTYESPEREFPWKLREVKQGEKFTLSWLSYPTGFKTDLREDDMVWGRFWQPRNGPKRGPAVVLLHWLGASFDTLEVIGQRLAEQGLPTLMIYLPGYGPRRAKDADPKERAPSRDLDHMISGLRQAVFDIRRAGDWLASRPDVEPSRVGLVGISLGGLVGSLAAGVDDHFGRSVFLIAGGDLAAIVMHGSRETEQAKARLEKDGYTVEKLRARCRPVDPLTFASRVRPEEILMLNAEADEVIPRDCTLQLHRALGSPELRWFKGGHYALLFQLGKALQDILAHVGQRTAW